MLKVPDGTLRILVQGAPARASSATASSTSPTWSREIDEAPDVRRAVAGARGAVPQRPARPSRQIVEQVPYLPEELQLAVANLDDPAELAHMIAGALRIKTEEKQELLEERDVAKRLRRLSELLAREPELISIGIEDPVAGPVRDRTRASASSSCASS